MQYTIQKGEQKKNIDYDTMINNDAFLATDSKVHYEGESVYSPIKYDLIGKICEQTELTRSTVATILQGIEKSTFSRFKQNPEHFISESIRLISEQKATMIIEHLTYNTTDEVYDTTIFTDAQANQNISNAIGSLKKHIFDYVVTDSKIEKDFARELDVSSDVEVYSKLPKGFHIPTPVGNYNPDWAIAFKKGSVKHVYFVAETKGSMSSMDLRDIEKTKIECARKFFNQTDFQLDVHKVKYDVVNTFSKLMDIVGN